MFVGVFTGCFPCHVPGLMKYGSTMQDFPERSYYWRFHDENFWCLRQAPATLPPRGTIHWELWLCSQNLVLAKRVQTSARTGKLMSSLRIPRGLCFTYHRGGDCILLGMIVLNVRAPTVL